MYDVLLMLKLSTQHCVPVVGRIVKEITVYENVFVTDFLFYYILVAFLMHCLPNNKSSAIMSYFITMFASQFQHT